MVNNTTLQHMKENNKRKTKVKKIKNKCLTLSFIAFTFSFYCFPTSCNMTTTPTSTLVLICCYVHISTRRYYHHILSLDNILFGNNPPYKWDYYSSKLRQYCLFGDHILEICVNPYDISNTSFWV